MLLSRGRGQALRAGARRPGRAAPAACSRPRALRVLSCAAPAPVAQAAPQQAITLTDRALAHLTKMRAEAGSGTLLLRVGVKQGGCSGMSYAMDFESLDNVKEDDYVLDYEGGFKIAVDPKSLLYLFGMRLDFSDALIGGGFQFHNPNATDSCGCGKSFGV